MAKVITVKCWAWVHTDPAMEHAPIIAIDERREDVAEEKRKCFKGTNPEHGRMMRSLWRKSKVVPAKVTFEI